MDDESVGKKYFPRGTAGVQEISSQQVLLG